MRYSCILRTLCATLSGMGKSAFNPKALRSKRRQREYSQQTMAMFLGITRGAYNKIELGKTRPSATTLFRICSVFQSPIDDFFIKEEISNNIVDNADTIV